jgi:hypothetical protein
MDSLSSQVVIHQRVVLITHPQKIAHRQRATGTIKDLEIFPDCAFNFKWNETHKLMTLSRLILRVSDK